jgi:hypothetical protein
MGDGPLASASVPAHPAHRHRSRRRMFPWLQGFQGHGTAAGVEAVESVAVDDSQDPSAPHPPFALSKRSARGMDADV